jgi:hypothetical protein
VRDAAVELVDLLERDALGLVEAGSDEKRLDAEVRVLHGRVQFRSGCGVT